MTRVVYGFLGLVTAAGLVGAFLDRWPAAVVSVAALAVGFGVYRLTQDDAILRQEVAELRTKVDAFDKPLREVMGSVREVEAEVATLKTRVGFASANAAANRGGR